MTTEQLNKARSYAIDKMRYNEIHSIFNEIETTVKENFDFFFILFYFLIIGFIINRNFTMAMDIIWKYISKIWLS